MGLEVQAIKLLPRRRRARPLDFRPQLDFGHGQPSWRNVLGRGDDALAVQGEHRAIDSTCMAFEPPAALGVSHPHDPGPSGE